MSTLGTLSRLEQEQLYKIFSFLDVHDLIRASRVSTLFFLLHATDELWRALTLLRMVDDDKVAQFTFKGSWKATLLFPWRNQHADWRGQSIMDAHAATAFHCRQVPTPTTHASWLRSSSSVNCLLSRGMLLRIRDAATFTPKPSFLHYNVRGYDLRELPMNLQGIDRRHKLSVEEFRREYEIPNLPVILTGMTDHWPARSKWQLDELVRRHPDLLLKTNSRSTNGKRFRMKLFDFLAYCHSWNGEKPLYIFDKKIMQEGSVFLQDYEVPQHFREDLFELMEEDERPDYRWLLLGPNGSGSPFHTDPHGSSAWNAVMEGCKRVSFYPPDVIPPGVDEDLIHSEYYASEDTMDWYRNIYPTLPADKRPLEVLVFPGEILFIPSGWWHQVQNIGHTIAVTQNYCSTITFPLVAKDMNAHAKRGVRKDFKIALSESEKYRHLADHITVKKR